MATNGFRFGESDALKTRGAGRVTTPGLSEALALINSCYLTVHEARIIGIRAIERAREVAGPTNLDDARLRRDPSRKERIDMWQARQIALERPQVPVEPAELDEPEIVPDSAEGTIGE